MMLLPQFGGGWTECQVAELHNGSVLLTSRNFFDRRSGQGPRLFARSDDGGASWAANWSAGPDLPDPYCEGIAAGPRTLTFPTRSQKTAIESLWWQHPCCRALMGERSILATRRIRGLVPTSQSTAHMTAGARGQRARCSTRARRRTRDWLCFVAGVEWPFSLSGTFIVL